MYSYVFICINGHICMCVCVCKYLYTNKYLEHLLYVLLTGVIVGLPLSNIAYM